MAVLVHEHFMVILCGCLVLRVWHSVSRQFRFQTDTVLPLIHTVRRVPPVRMVQVSEESFGPQRAAHPGGQRLVVPHKAQRVAHFVISSVSIPCCTVP